MERRVKERWRGGWRRGGEEGEGEAERRVKERWRGGTAGEEAEVR